MNYQLFINQQVKDYKGETGYVVAFDKDHIVIQQGGEQITCNPDIAFKRKALVFLDDKYNDLVNGDMADRDNASIIYQQKIDKINKEAIKRNKMASDKYIELEKKDKALKRLFGYDFVYPPFALLKKRFPHAKRKRNEFEMIIEHICSPILKPKPPKDKNQNVQS